MKTPLCILAAFALAWAAPAFAEEKTAAQLVEQLRSDDFDQRSAAAAALEKLGESARAVLERAAKDKDADVRAQAVKILTGLAKATVLFIVRDLENNPVANVEGSLTTTRGDAEVFPATREPNSEPLKIGADGTATLKLDRMGNHTFQLTIPGFTAGGADVAINARAGQNHALLTLAHGGTLRGSIDDGEGKPLADAEVTAFYAGSLDMELLELQIENLEELGFHGTAAHAGQDGKWRLDNLAEGVYYCVAKAAGHKPTAVKHIRVREKQITDVPAIVLAPRKPGKIELKLLNPDGKPLAKTGVHITLTSVLTDQQRRRVMQWQNGSAYRQEDKTTDENGVVVSEDIVPGKFQLTVTAPGRNEQTTLIDAEIEVTPGETLRPEPKPPLKPGSLKGRIVAADGKGAKDISVQLWPERDVLPGATFEQGMFFNNMTPHEAPNVITNSKGEYSFETLRPGKYVAFFSYGTEELSEPNKGYVCGIEVRAGQKAEAPDAVIPKTPAEKKRTVLTGRVLTPAGVPAQNAEVSHHSIAGSENTNTSDDGTFSIRVAPRSGGGFVVIRQSGCKPLLIELPFQNNADYRLEKQEFGVLRVSVSDESGKPLAGVSVTAVSGAVQQMFVPQPEGMQTAAQSVTNHKGFARLTGLAAGKRELKVAAEGFYLPAHAGDVEVAANEEREVKLVLRAGASIAGRVRVPEGVPASQILVTLQSGPRCIPAGANGEFSFDGVMAGEHIICVSAPGWIQKQSVKISVLADSEPRGAAQREHRLPSEIELVRPCGIAIDCGKAFAGYQAWLTPWPDMGRVTEPMLTNWCGGIVDGDGRWECWSIPPGQYAFNVKPPYMTYDTTARFTAAVVAGPVEVSPLDSRSKLATLPAMKVTLSGIL